MSLRRFGGAIPGGQPVGGLAAQTQAAFVFVPSIRIDRHGTHRVREDAPDPLDPVLHANLPAALRPVGAESRVLREPRQTRHEDAQLALRHVLEEHPVVQHRAGRGGNRNRGAGQTVSGPAYSRARDVAA